MNNVYTTPTDEVVGRRAAKELGVEIVNNKLKAGVTYTLPGSDIYEGLFKKLISMEELKYFARGMDAPFYSTNEAWINGLKTYVYQGLYTIDKDKDVYADLTIADFNADFNEFKEMVYTTTESGYSKYTIYANELKDAFTSYALLGRFVSQRIANMQNTWAMFFDGLRNSYVWSIQNPNFSATTVKADYDKEVAILTAAELITDDGMKKFLYEIRKQLIQYKIPHQSHLKLNNNKFLYGNPTGQNLVLLVKDTIFVQIANLTAQLFNKEDVMSKLNMMAVPVSLIEGYDESRDGGKLAILYDKRKMRNGVFINQLGNSIKLPLFRSMYESYSKFGFASLATFPAILYKVKVNLVKSSKDEK